MSVDNLEDFTAGEDIVKALRSASRYKTEAETAKAQVKTLTNEIEILDKQVNICLLYTSPSPRD